MATEKFYRLPNPASYANRAPLQVDVKKLAHAQHIQHYSGEKIEHTVGATNTEWVQLQKVPQHRAAEVLFGRVLKWPEWKQYFPKLSVGAKVKELFGAGDFDIYRHKDILFVLQTFEERSRLHLVIPEIPIAQRYNFTPETGVIPPDEITSKVVVPATIKKINGREIGELGSTPIVRHLFHPIRWEQYYDYVVPISEEAIRTAGLHLSLYEGRQYMIGTNGHAITLQNETRLVQEPIEKLPNVVEYFLFQQMHDAYPIMSWRMEGPYFLTPGELYLADPLQVHQ